MLKQQIAVYYILQQYLVYCRSFILPARERLSNIGLTFKAWPELLRGIGVVFASSSSKNHDKRLYKVEACVRNLLNQ